jgi:hypothetical protein
MGAGDVAWDAKRTKRQVDLRSPCENDPAVGWEMYEVSQPSSRSAPRASPSLPARSGRGSRSPNF